MTVQEARALAADWHGGQWSALYSLASSGSTGDLCALAQEINACRKHATEEQLAELFELALWLLEQAAEEEEEE